MKTSLEKYTSHFIVRVRKGLLKVCVWEGVGDRTELSYFDPHSWPSALCLSRSPGLLNRRPRGSAFCWVLAFSTTSCHPRVSKHHRGSRGTLRPGVAFPTTSYQQLLWTPTHQGPKGPLRLDSSTTSCLPTRLISNWSALLSWLSYIIV